MMPINRDTSFTSISRDEMNLVEFPISVLSKRVDPNLKTLEFTDYISSKNGEKIERKWIITGADKFGLPTSSDDEVLLGLLKLSVDAGLSDRKVYFTRYELLRVLQWSTEGRSYGRLQKALDRLSGVRIKASNAFYDNDSKRYNTRNFGLIDEYEISSHRGGDLPNSYFVWSDVLFNSFKVGFIKRLDLSFYLSLKTAVAKRLFRYLDKHFWYKGVISRNLFSLCHEKLGVSRNYKYSSALIQQIEPGLKELIERGFLGSVEFSGRGKHTQITLSAGSSSVGQSSEVSSVGTTAAAETDSKVLQSLAGDLVARGLKPTQTRRLLEAKSESELVKIPGIIRYYDELIAKRSRLVSRSPVGFLFRAVENAETFTLPNRFDSSAGVKPEAQPDKKVELLAVPAKQSEVTLDTKALIDKCDARQLAELTKEVELALAKLRGVISERRFDEAVRHGVAKKLSALSGV
jgi:hypothetical protein